MKCHGGIKAGTSARDVPKVRQDWITARAISQKTTLQLQGENKIFWIKKQKRYQKRTTEGIEGAGRSPEGGKQESGVRTEGRCWR